MPKGEKVSGYSQKYTTKWKKDHELKDWIGPDPSGVSDLAYCKYCRISLKCHRKGLIDHLKTNKHQNCVLKEKLALTTKKLDSTFKPVVTEKIKIAELKIAAFIAEHCSLKTVDHMVSMLPQLDPLSDTLSKFKLHRTKFLLMKFEHCYKENVRINQQQSRRSPKSSEQQH
ncbi:hypothetical protein KQX54_008224 [Cotesia glomerata]|uniref:Uncharacterized protein n=1 Tax=Cotesia glomerata TaxID=32391 RepID=A0AAV7HWT3_COTGL|nr:hypothetical protein KQX54_008224 [Cotesia glomerata]